MPKAKKKGQQKPRVLVDANTLFSSVYYPRFDFEILEHSIRGEITFFLSVSYDGTFLFKRKVWLHS